MSGRGDWYAWRVIATGLCFTSFGLGGLVLWLVVFPLLNRLPGDRIRRGRRTVQLSFRLFIAMMRSLGVLRWELHGGAQLRQPGCLYIANHPSLIDVIFLVSLIPDVNCIVKQSLFRNPCMRGAVVGAGYIANADSADTIDAAADSLRRGESLLMFPEGTRTRPGAALRFQRGAAHIALRSGAPVCPVTIRCVPPTLAKHERWYQVPPRRIHYTIDVKEPVEPTWTAGGKNDTPLAARNLTRWLQNFFTREIAA